MDRNFFFAMALSFVVLMVYQGIFVPPKRPEALKNTQIIENKIDTSKAESAAISLSESIEETTKKPAKEEITKLESNGHYVELSNVGGSLHNVEFAGNEKGFPVENLLTVKGFESAAFTLKDHTKDSASYTYQDSSRRIIKTYKIEDNSIKTIINIENLSKSSSLENIQFKLINFNHEKIKDISNRNAMLDEVSILFNKKVIRKGVANKFNDKDSKLEAGEVGWVGFRDHFHMLLIDPEFETKSYERQVLNENQLVVTVSPKEEQIAPETSRTYNFTVVAGDQSINWLKTYKKGYEQIVAFSNYWILEVISKGIYYTIPFLYSICHSWGFSIILVSVLIYGITYPLTLKSMTSMKKMQQVQPKVAALQKRYKDDPKKLNTEMVELYRLEKVNPLAGCLPFLLQMPIFIALYQVLWRSYYFQGKSFLWIKDLAQPDRLAILPFSIPFLGNELNILPIAMAGVMFLQQTITSKTMVITDETQAMQQKMMKYIFPFFIGFIFYKFASGLSLYFTVFYALSAWAQWNMSRSK